MTQLINNSQLANRIRNTRKLRKLSQQTLAKLSGVDQSQVSRLESEKVSQPTVQDIASLAASLSLPVESLISMHDEEFELLLKLQASEEEMFAPDGQEADDPAQLRRELLDKLGGGLNAQGLVEQMETWIAGGGHILLSGETLEQEATAHLLLGLSSLGEAVVSRSYEAAPLSGHQMATSLKAVEAGSNASRLPTLSGFDDLVEYLDHGPKRSGGVIVDWNQILRTPERIGSSQIVRRLCESGLIRLDFTGQGEMGVEQLLYTQGGGLATLPLYLLEQPEGLRHINDPVAASAPRGAGMHTPEGLTESLLVEDKDRDLVVDPSIFQHGVLLTGAGDARRSALAWLTAAACDAPGGTLLITPDEGVAMSAYRLAEQGMLERQGHSSLYLLDNSGWGFNPLDVRSPHQIPARVEMIGDWMEKMLGLDSVVHAQALAYARLAAWALCEANLRGLVGSGARPFNLMQIGTFLSDTEMRAVATQFCTNLAIRETFDVEGEFDCLGKEKQSSIIAPLLLALHQLTTNRAFMSIFAAQEQQRCIVNDHHLLDQAMQEGECVIICQPKDAFTFRSLASMFGHLLAQESPAAQSACTVLLDEAGSTFGPHLYPAVIDQRSNLHMVLSAQSPDDFSAEDFAVLRRNLQSFISCRLDSLSARPVSELIASGGPLPQPADLATLEDHQLWAKLRRVGSSPNIPLLLEVDISDLTYSMAASGLHDEEIAQGDGSAHVGESIRVLQSKIRRRMGSWQTIEGDDSLENGAWDWDERD